MVKRLIRLIKRFLKSINELRFRKHKIIRNDNQLKPYYDSNLKIKEMKSLTINNNTKGKWVGAVNYNNYMYCIPNKYHSFLKINLENNEIKNVTFKYDNIDEFLWSGGCTYNDIIYGFPRYSNDLIAINPKNDQVKLIPLGINYQREHHYGGICTKKGIVYQPPRNNNTILRIDLNNYKVEEIKISPAFLKYNYATGLLDANGIAYFFPTDKGKIMVLNTNNESISFIGKSIYSCTFGPCFGFDGNIYGFSSYSNGIMKLDTLKNTVKIIHQEIGCPGCYGNKLGINGKIYGIPGNGKYLWEYDIEKDIVCKVEELNDEYAKCAGGIVTKNGTIYTVPAFGNKVYMIKFDVDRILSDEELEYYNDNY